MNRRESTPTLRLQAKAIKQNIHIQQMQDEKTYRINATLQPPERTRKSTINAPVLSLFSFIMFLCCLLRCVMSAGSFVVPYFHNIETETGNRSTNLSTHKIQKR